MVEALIGAVIAVIATSALTLLAQVVVNVETAGKSSLTDYELRVLGVVKSAHTSSQDDYGPDLLDWMKKKAKVDPDGL